MKKVTESKTHARRQKDNQKTVKEKTESSLNIRRQKNKRTTVEKNEEVLDEVYGVTFGDSGVCGD